MVLWTYRPCASLIFRTPTFGAAAAGVVCFDSISPSENFADLPNHRSFFFKDRAFAGRLAPTMKKHLDCPQSAELLVWLCGRNLHEHRLVGRAAAARHLQPGAFGRRGATVGADGRRRYHRSPFAARSATRILAWPSAS